MFDCHAHLTDASLKTELAGHLTDAEAEGVRGIIAVSESLEDAQEVLDLCERINNDPRHRTRLHPAIGMHPEKADLSSLEIMLELIHASSNALACVGEVGLDYSRHLIGESGTKCAERAKEVQREVFARQARCAHELGLAVNVHSRAAGHHAIKLLREEGVTRAVFHAFDGKPKYAVEAARGGYYFSVPPNVSRSQGFQKLVQALPLESLLLETDSPALGPVKNETNTPKNVKVACEWIAQLKGVPMTRVIEMSFSTDPEQSFHHSGDLPEAKLWGDAHIAC